MAPRHIREIMPLVLSEARVVRPGRHVSILTLDESPEVLLGLLGSAVESGLLTSMCDIETVRVNGRTVSRSLLF